MCVCVCGADGRGGGGGNCFLTTKYLTISLNYFIKGVIINHT